MAFRDSATPLLSTTTNATDIMRLPTVDGMREMGCDLVCSMRYAMDSAMDDGGIASPAKLAALEAFTSPCIASVVSMFDGGHSSSSWVK